MAKAAKNKDARAKRPTVKRTALGPIGKLEDFIPYKLSVVANRVSQSIGRLFETQFNIQMPEWRIMMALYAYDDLVFNEVVERTSMDKARVSRAQRRLVDLQLITSVNDPTSAQDMINFSIPAGTYTYYPLGLFMAGHYTLNVTDTNKIVQVSPIVPCYAG